VEAREPAKGLASGKPSFYIHQDWEGSFAESLLCFSGEGTFSVECGVQLNIG
jgi:hypothetical protein